MLFFWAQKYSIQRPAKRDKFLAAFADNVTAHIFINHFFCQLFAFSDRQNIFGAYQMTKGNFSTARQRPIFSYFSKTKDSVDCIHQIYITYVHNFVRLFRAICRCYIALLLLFLCSAMMIFRFDILKMFFFTPYVWVLARKFH